MCESSKVKKILIIYLMLVINSTSIITNNICTFSIEDKLFSFLKLQKQNPFKKDINSKQRVQFSFCQPFVPQDCPNDSPKAFSFLIQEKQNITLCSAFSSDSVVVFYNATYEDKLGAYLTLNMNIPYTQIQKSTSISIACDEQQDSLEITSAVLTDNSTKIYIVAKSSTGCPLFQISRIWQALQHNKVLFGIVLFILGFQSLFFGRIMIVVTIFIAGYLVCFATLCAIATAFVGPHSSIVLIYFTLVVVIFSSTLLAYGITKLVGVSIFFIGAWFGFIVGALLNSSFCGLFHVYSSKSLIIFQILFTLLGGLLTLKYSNQVIIVSTCLTGSYMMIRPLSWMFGGFPNEFTLQELFESGRLNALPGSFFLYLALIVILSIVGGLYQFLKLRRQDPSEQVEVSYLECKIQNSIDKVKQTIDKIIQRYKSDHHHQDYSEMKQINNKQQQPSPNSK